MVNLTALIVDDEEFARENLRMLLEDYCPEIIVSGMAGSVQEARDKIYSLQPQVVFLDIRMPSGAEGFDLLDSIPDKTFQVVFATAFKDYAIRAFNANATHYILKPIDIDDLRSAVDRVLEHNKLFLQEPGSFKEYLDSMEIMTRNIREQTPVNRITINHAKGFKIVEDENIIALEAQGNCTLLHFKDGTEYLDTRTLKIYDQMLDKRKFFRTHKSSMINLHFLKEYLNDGGHFAILKNGSKWDIARNRLPEFMEVARNSL